MNVPQPSRWPELFDVAMAIVDQANDQGIGMSNWSFGGGTALMLQIQHRESHDIDLFIDDAQYLPYLNPETQGYNLALAPSDYETDGTRALKIVFNGVGEIDFICCDPVTQEPYVISEIRGRRVKLETPAEILAKKVVFRGSHLQPGTCSTSPPSPMHWATTTSLKPAPDFLMLPGKRSPSPRK